MSFLQLDDSVVIIRGNGGTIKFMLFVHEYARYHSLIDAPIHRIQKRKSGSA